MSDNAISGWFSGVADSLKGISPSSPLPSQRIERVELLI